MTPDYEILLVRIPTDINQSGDVVYENAAVSRAMLPRVGERLRAQLSAVKHGQVTRPVVVDVKSDDYVRTQLLADAALVAAREGLALVAVSKPVDVGPRHDNITIMAMFYTATPLTELELR